MVTNLGYDCAHTCVSYTGLILAHFDGLVAGYNANTPASKALTVEDLYFLNSLGDMLDLHVANVKVS